MARSCCRAAQHWTELRRQIRALEIGIVSDHSEYLATLKRLGVSDQESFSCANDRGALRAIAIIKDKMSRIVGRSTRKHKCQ